MIHNIFTIIDRFPFDIPGVRVITHPIMSIACSVFRQYDINHRDNIIYGHKINNEYQKEFRKNFIKAHPEIIEMGLCEEPEKKDEYYSLRIAFKVSCIFFCIYMAYPMI